MTNVTDAPAARREFTPEEFGVWVEPSVRAMALLAARLAGPDDCDDVVQEALSRAWRKRSQFDPSRGTPSAWLLAITADQARRARRRPRLQPSAGHIPATVRPIDDRLDLSWALERLPKRQRLAVDCYYFAGLSVAETAAVMGCAVGTVKSTLSDARTRLRLILEVSDGSS